jgi:hypothetical protein
MHTITKTMLALTAFGILLAPLAAASHSVELTSGKPKAGDYTMTVDVQNFNLVPFAGKSGADAHKKGEGHIHYLINDKPAHGDYATTSKTFTFHDLKAGDKVSAELVLSDHSASGTDSSGTLDGSRVLSEASVEGGGMGIPGISPVLLLGLLAGLALLFRRT